MSTIQEQSARDKIQAKLKDDAQKIIDGLPTNQILTLPDGQSFEVQISARSSETPMIDLKNFAEFQYWISHFLPNQEGQKKLFVKVDGKLLEISRITGPEKTERPDTPINDPEAMYREVSKEAIKNLKQLNREPVEIKAKKPLKPSILNNLRTMLGLGVDMNTPPQFQKSDAEQRYIDAKKLPQVPVPTDDFDLKTSWDDES